MNTHDNNTKENKRQSVSNGESQVQSSGESTFQFVDNRPEAVAQRKRNAMVNKSSVATQLKSKQNTVDNSPQVHATAQLQATADNASANPSPTPKSANNTGLPDNLKSGMENLSGMSLDDVKVHRNSDKPAQLQAHAYAQGTNIHLGPGQEKHLPHEAWHVVQQKQGRVKATMQMKGKVNVNDDAGLEKEADVMGAKALHTHGRSDVNELVQRVSNISSVNTKSTQLQSVVHPEVNINKAPIQLEDGDEEPKSRPRRGAVVESLLEQEEIEYLQQYRKVTNILKFNFAGSGEEEWATHAPKEDKTHWFKPDDKGDTPEEKEEKLKARGEEAEHQSGGKKYSKKKNTLDKSKIVFEYAGPLALSGAVDMGANSTEANIKDAKGHVLKFMSAYVKAQNYAPDMPNVQINIKGFSRGAATATEFADWIKQTKYGKLVAVNLVVFDPVQGSSLTGGDLFGAMRKRKTEQDVSSLYDEEQPEISGTTYVFPVKSGYEHFVKGFTVQKVSGYQRVIIGYGNHASHSFGVKGFMWNGEAIKGMELSKLPQGLFIAKATSVKDLEKGVNPILQKVNSLDDWQKLEPKITGKAKSLQNRDDATRTAVEIFLMPKQKKLMQ